MTLLLRKALAGVFKSSLTVGDTNTDALGESILVEEIWVDLMCWAARRGVIGDFGLAIRGNNGLL